MKSCWAWLLPALLLATGCASSKSSSTPRAEDRIPARDRVLWQDRQAATAMRAARFEEAKRTLDEVLPRIGGIIANDKDAAKARSLFHAEARKTFIGEPYERVMAYYYRGILSWMDGEPDNARACFRSAQFQDADTENHTYAADYVLLDYLDGLATTKLGGDGSDELKRAKANARGSAPPPYHARANVLIFLEFGHGPMKYGTGSYQQELRFASGAPSASQVNLRLGTQQFRLVPYDDLYFQATTRGGRVMDHILGNKAVFKTVTDVVGDAGIISGLALAATRNNEAAAIVGGIGVVSKVLSALTVPTADTRTWDNLPQYLSFAALELPAGTYTLAADFLDAGGRLIMTKQVTVTVTNPAKDTVVFLSELNH